MAANPVQAFLAGFQAVDNLETSRQLRKFEAERQSQLRKLWARQDEEWARQQLALRQQDNYLKYQLQSEALMEEIAMHGEKAYQANLSAPAPVDTDGNQIMTSEEAAEQAKQAYYNQWFNNKTMVNGKPAGFLRFSTEVVNRLIAANPEFGEHMALSAKFDAANGEFVRDPSKPVSGILGLDPEHDPDGLGGFIPLIDATTNPYAPGTVNRTASDNDPLFVGRVTPEFLANMFGPQILHSQDAMAIMLRNQFGIEPGSVTQKRVEAAPEPQAEPQAEPKPEPEPTAGQPGYIPAPEDDLLLPHFRDPKDVQRDADLREAEQQLNDKWERSRNRIPNAAERAVDRYGREVPNAFDIYRPRPTEEAIEKRADQIAARREVGESFTDNAVVGAVENFLNKFESNYSDQDKALAKDVRDNPTPENISAKAEQVAAPQSKEEAQATAKQVENDEATSTRVGRRPTTPEIYRALRLVQSPANPYGVLSSEQFMNYAQTGSFNGPAKKIVQHAGNGIFVYHDEAGNFVGTRDLSNLVSGGGAGELSIEAIKKSREELTAQIETLPYMWRTDEMSGEQYLDEGRVRELQSLLNDVFAWQKLRPDDTRRHIDSVIGGYGRGYELLDQYEDPRWVNEYAIPKTAGNLLVATAIANSTNYSKKESSLALRHYLQDFRDVGLALGVLQPDKIDGQMLIAIPVIEQKAKILYQTDSSVDSISEGRERAIAMFFEDPQRFENIGR